MDSGFVKTLIQIELAAAALFFLFLVVILGYYLLREQPSTQDNLISRKK